MDEQSIVNLKNIYNDLRKAIVDKDTLNADLYSMKIYDLLQSLTKENADDLVNFLEKLTDEENNFKNYILELLIKDRKIIEDSPWNSSKINDVTTSLYTKLELFVKDYLKKGLNDVNTEDNLDSIMVIIEDCIENNSLFIIDNVLLSLAEEVFLKEDEEKIEMYEWLKSLIAKRISVEFLPVTDEDEQNQDVKYDVSTIMILPVVLIADDKKIEVPSINVLEKLIKAEFHKRKIVDFSEINLGTVVYALSEIEDVQYNDIFSVHMYVIDEVSKNISIDEQNRLKELRLNTTIYEGDSSICFFVLNLKIEKESLENIYKKQELFEKAVKDKDLWEVVSKKLKNIYSNYSVLEPSYINITKESINRYKIIALMKTWLKKNSKNIDVIYAHDELEENYYVLLSDVETGHCLQSFSCVISDNKLEWLESIKKSCDEENVILYKYNQKLSEEDYQKILTVDDNNTKDLSYDLNDMIKNSTIVGREWENWTSVNIIKSNKILH